MEWKHYFKSIVVALIIAGVFAMVSWDKNSNNLWFYWGSVFGIAIATCLATEGVLLGVNFGKRYDKLIEGSIAKMEKKLNSAIEIMILDAEDGVFRNQLDQLRNLTNESRWIMMRFMAKKLSSDFREMKFQIDSQSYSALSQHLYTEVNSSLLLSSPFNPYEWFRELVSSVKQDDLRKELIAISYPTAGNRLPDVDKFDAFTPLHVRAWREIGHHQVDGQRKIDRKRIVILHKNEMENFFVYAPFFLFFRVINKSTDADTAFITDEELANWNIAGLSRDNYNEYDYAFYDSKIALEWRCPSKNDKSDLRMIDLEKTDNHRFSDFHKEVLQRWHSLEKLTQMELRIKEQRLKFFNAIMGTVKDCTIPHYWCYYAFGGDCWQNINNSTTNGYTLGAREQEHLEGFLGKAITEITKKQTSNNPQRYDVLHIGVGSGKESERILNGFACFSQKIKIENYRLVDISPNILQRAKETLTHLSPLAKGNVHFSYECKNVFTEMPERMNSNPIIIVLVANGYLFSNRQLIINLEKFMTKSDYLFVTTETRSENLTPEDEKRIKASYMCEPVLKLFNISLNLIGVDTIDPNFFSFEFDQEYKYRFVGKFKFADWKNTCNKEYSVWKKKYEGEKFAKALISNIENIKDINIFTSFKPQNKDDVGHHLTTCGATHLKIVDGSYEPDDQCYMAGYIIKKEEN